jgi:hypothetical protein
LVLGEVRGGEYHDGRTWSTNNGGLNLCTSEELAWCSVLAAAI